MIRPIVKDTFFLQQKCMPAGKEDTGAGKDLLDTLRAHQKECAGLAANMIGIRKNIIAVSAGPLFLVMFNPVIRKKKDPFETTEGCLSLSGMRNTIRYREIEMEYQDMNFQTHHQSFNGWTAQVIQHECDHLQGILI